MFLYTFALLCLGWGPHICEWSGTHLISLRFNLKPFSCSGNAAYVGGHWTPCLVRSDANRRKWYACHNCQPVSMCSLWLCTLLISSTLTVSLFYGSDVRVSIWKTFSCLNSSNVGMLCPHTYMFQYGHHRLMKSRLSRFPGSWILSINISHQSLQGEFANRKTCRYKQQRENIYVEICMWYTSNTSKSF
jgi:hypothetical protein